MIGRKKGEGVLNLTCVRHLMVILLFFCLSKLVSAGGGASLAEQDALRRHLSVETTSNEVNPRRISGINFGNGVGVTFYRKGQDSKIYVVEQDLRVGTIGQSETLGIAGMLLTDIGNDRIPQIFAVGKPNEDTRVFIVRGSGPERELVHGVISWISPPRDNFVTTIESSEKDLGAGIWTDIGELVGVVTEIRPMPDGKSYAVAIPAFVAKDFLKELFPSAPSSPKKIKKK